MLLGERQGIKKNNAPCADNCLKIRYFQRKHTSHRARFSVTPCQVLCDVIEAVQARGGNLAGAPAAGTPAAINQQSDLLGQLMGRLNVVFERYPELKA